MNSVFSAFKSSSGSSSTKNENKYKFTANKGIVESSSYENLKHIREISSMGKMADFVVEDTDNSAQSIHLRKTNAATIQNQIIEHHMNEISNDGEDVVDSVQLSLNETVVSRQNPVNDSRKLICASESNLYNDHDNDDDDDDQQYLETANTSPCNSLNNLSQMVATVIPKVNFSSEGDILTSCKENNIINDVVVGGVAVDSNQFCKPIIKPTANANTKINELSLLANKVNTNRFQKRLSLSGIGNSMPSVHGRPASANGRETNKKTRLSTHQRNLSLDFR